MLTTVAGGENVDGNGITEWPNCGANNSGYEHLSDKEILVNWREGDR